MDASAAVLVSAFYTSVSLFVLIGLLVFGLFTGVVAQSLACGAVVAIMLINLPQCL